MDPNRVLSKTAKGKEEIETRKHKLDQRLRTVLITVNGKLTVRELVSQFAQTGDITPLLDQLLREGYVQPALDPAVRLKQARAELAAALSAALGPDADNMAIQIEAANTLEELRGYLEERRALLDGALKAKAGAFWAKVASLTS